MVVKQTLEILHCWKGVGFTQSVLTVISSRTLDSDGFVNSIRWLEMVPCKTEREMALWIVWQRHGSNLEGYRVHNVSLSWRIRPCNHEAVFPIFLVMTEQFTRWPDTIPFQDIFAGTIVKTFITTWVSRYGTPAIVTTRVNILRGSCLAFLQTVHVPSITFQ